MLVRLSARSHTSADVVVPRFDLMIPVGGPVIEAEVTAAQLAHLQADPWITIGPASGPASGDSHGDDDESSGVPPLTRAQRRAAEKAARDAEKAAE